MAKVKGAIVVDVEKCKGCEICLDSCPTNVLEMTENVNGKGYHYVYMKKPEECTGCVNCALVCPDGVISVYRYKMTG